MLETEARVVAVAPDGAWVEPRPHSPCGQCDPEHGCRSLQLARAFSLRQPTFRVLNPLGARVGDWVVVAVPEGSMLHSAVLLYALPLLALLAGALLGAQWSEHAAVLLSLAALLLCLLLVRRHARRLAGDVRFQPHISRRVDVSIIPMESATTCRSRN